MEWNFLVATSLTVSTTLAFMTLIPSVIMCTARYMPHETGSRDNSPHPIYLQVMPVLASQASKLSSFHIKLTSGLVSSFQKARVYIMLTVLNLSLVPESVVSLHVKLRIHEVYTAQVVIIVSCMIHCIQCREAAQISSNHLFTLNYSFLCQASSFLDLMNPLDTSIYF